MKFYFYYTKDIKTVSLGIRLRKNTYFLDVNKKSIIFEKYKNTVKTQYYDFIGIEDNTENIYYSVTIQDIEQLKKEFPIYSIR